MNRSRSKPAKKTRHSADIITTEELAAMRDVRLCQRGLAGDVDAMIQWLAAFGGPEWQLPEDMQPPDRHRHDRERPPSV